MRELFASLRAIMPAWAGAELTVFAVLIILLVFWSTYQLIPENPHAWECIHHQHPQTINWVVIIVSFFFGGGGYVIELSGRQFETGPETEQKMLISWKPLDKQGRDRGVSCWMTGWLSDGSPISSSQSHCHSFCIFIFIHWAPEHLPDRGLRKKVFIFLLPPSWRPRQAAFTLVSHAFLQLSNGHYSPTSSTLWMD